MAIPTPRSLSALCQTSLPLMLRHSSGKRMLSRVADIVESDRWNSFDHFHRTTEKQIGRAHV